MSHFLETHGIEVLVCYYLFACFVSSLDPLPPNSSYMARTLFNFLHLLGSNVKPLMGKIGISLPDIAAVPNSVTVKTEVKQTTVENKTEEATKP